MYSSAITSSSYFSWMNCDALAELLVGLDKGRLRDAVGRFFFHRLDEERET